MQQRYYDPGIGQGLSVDPVTAYDSKDWWFFNRYAYAFNNPYKFNDPDGRCPTCDRFSDNYSQAAQQGRQGEFAPFVIPAVAVVAVMAAPVAAEVGMAALANPGVIATATNVAAEAAGVTGVAGAGAAGARAVSVEAKAAQLSARAGANSVTVKTASGQVRYDLQGASHFSKAAQADIPTPHVQGYTNNVIPSGPNAGQIGNISKSGDVVPATMQDMRTVEKVLDKREQLE